MESNSVPPDFPAGMRVLIVDQDALSLMILELELLIYNYEVRTCKLVSEALDELGEHNEKFNFDMVIIDLDTSDRDVFRFIQNVVHKLDVLVITMSKYEEMSNVIKGIQSGACIHLSKPVEDKEAQFIWQYAYLKRMSKQPQIVGECAPSPVSEIVLMAKKKKKKSGEGSSRGEEEHVSVKKPGVIWTSELHGKFKKAVAQIESANERISPTKILKLMGDASLTRVHIASHLQKYRDKNNRVVAAQVPNTNIHPQQLPQLMHQQNMMMDENYGQERRMQPDIMNDENYGHNMNSYREYINAYHHPSQLPQVTNFAHSYDQPLLPQLNENEFMSRNNVQNAEFNAHQNLWQHPPNLGAYSNNASKPHQIQNQIQNPPNMGTYGNNGLNTHQIQNPYNLGAYGNNGPHDYDSGSYDSQFQQ